MALQATENVPERVREALTTFTQYDFVAEAFAGFVVIDEKSQLKRWESSLEAYKTLVSNCQSPGQDSLAPLKCLIEEVYSGKYASRRLGVLLEFLNRLINDHCYTARQICEHLLNNPALSPNVSSIWVSVFRFVDANLSNVDYKGCRELLKIVLEKASSAFASDSDGGRRTMPQLQATYNLIARMLDRRSYFLPSYIAANSVKGDERLLRHWKFCSLLHPFLAGFRPIADILTPTGRFHYNPVIGFSSLYSSLQTSLYSASSMYSAWHLSVTNLRFQLTGPLPYREEATQPQIRLFSWLLKHTYSKEVIVFVLALPNPAVTTLPASMVESELASLLAECVTARPYVASGEARLWQHLTSQTIAIKHQFPSVPFSRFASCLVEKLKSILAAASTGSRIRGNRYKRLGEIFASRDCLMFLLAQYVMIGLQKGSADDYLPVFEVYDVLYNYRPNDVDEEDGDTTSSSSDDEMAVDIAPPPPPVFSQSPAEFIYSMAPATIWIAFAHKVANNDPGYCPPMPISIKKNVDLLHSLSASFQRSPPGAGSLAAGGGSVNGDPAPDLSFIAVCNALSYIEPHSQFPLMCVESLAQSSIPVLSNDNAYNGGMMDGNQSQLQQQYLSLPASWSPLRAPNNIRPLSMARLDLTSVLFRSNMLNQLFLRFRETLKNIVINQQQQQQGQNVALTFVSPALLETYVRLFAFHDVDSSCIRKICELAISLTKESHLPGAFMFLQIIGYRLPNVLQSHRSIILRTLLTGMPTQTTNFTFYSELEMATLSLVNSMTPVEFIQLLTSWYPMSESSSKRSGGGGGGNQGNAPNQQPPIAFSFSEDVNRITAWKFVINMRMAGADPSSSWARDAFSALKSVPISGGNSLLLPLSPEYLSAWLPQNIIEMLVRQNGSLPSSTQEIDQIKRSLVAEHNKYITLPVNMKGDYAQHMSSPSALAVFYCLVCRLIMESRGPTKAFCVRCLDRLGGPARPYSITLRVFIEYLVDEVANSAHQQKFTGILNEMIYQRGLFSVDRIVLAMSLYSVAPSSPQDVGLLNLIASLVSSEDLSQRISATVAHYSPNHWLDGEGFAGHTKYHSLFQELGLFDTPATDTQQAMPVYYGNCCLRLIRVLDYCFYRWLPLATSNSSITASLTKIIDSCGQLYAFHPKPVLFLYTSLYLLVDQGQTFNDSIVQLALKLTVTVLSVVSRHRELSWALPPRLLDHSSFMWQNDVDAICTDAARRIFSALHADPLLSNDIDYRFAEFANPSAHALFCASIDLIIASLATGSNRASTTEPVNGVELVTQSMLKLVFDCNLDDPRQPIFGSDAGLDRNGRLHSLCNAVALMVCSLPLCYLSATFSTIEQIVRQLPQELAPHLSPLHPVHLLTTSLLSPTLPCATGIDLKCGRLLALCHALLHHATFAHLSMMVTVLVRNHLAPIIITEEQLLFLFALFGPYMARINADPGNRQLCVDLATILYELLAQVDYSLASQGSHISNVNTVADFFYHLKYHYIGDAVRGRVEAAISQLSTPGLQHQLRFVVTTSANVAAANAPTASATPAAPASNAVGS